MMLQSCEEESKVLNWIGMDVNNKISGNVKLMKCRAVKTLYT